MYYNVLYIQCNKCVACVVKRPAIPSPDISRRNCVWAKRGLFCVKCESSPTYSAMRALLPIHSHTHSHTHTHTHTQIYMRIYICACVCVCAYMYMYIYIYIYISYKRMYVCIYIYTYIHVGVVYEQDTTQRYRMPRTPL
jgi:hypothetical protein